MTHQQTVRSIIRCVVKSTFSNLESVKVGAVDYRVLPNYDDKQGAAELLAFVDTSVNQLIQFMDNKYSDEVLATMSAPKRAIYEQIIRRLHSTYDQKNLEETVPSQPKVDVSYNIDKGQVLALCVRDYDTHEFQQKNDLLFVALHELSHSLNCDESAFQCGDSYGHGNMFWFIFKVLLENAEECGLYTKHNYRANPVNYCSMPITYSPLYDKSLSDNEFFSNR